MMSWLRRRRRAWGACIAGLFTASVLTIACNDCFAAEPPADPHPGNAAHHCLPDDAGAPFTGDSPPDSHCQGVCDCDAAGQTVLDLRAGLIDGLEQDKRSGSPVAYYLEPGLPSSSQSAASYQPGRSCAPERARFKPLERYCVLLN